MRDRLARLVTGFLAAVVEAWQELRIHRLRVLLSLFGVMVAVASLTGALAMAGIGQQVLVEQAERDGRPALIGISAWNPTTGSTAPADQMRAAVLTASERFDVTYVSVYSQAYDMQASSDGRSTAVTLSVVDPPYAAMHRLATEAGRWLEPEDAENRSPAVVVDDVLLESLGLSADQLPLTVEIGQKSPVTVTVVGTVPARQYTEQPNVFVLADAYQHWFSADLPLGDGAYEMWVPIEGSEQFADEIGRAIAAEMPGFQVDAFRQDYLSWGGDDGYRVVALVIGGVAGLILLLGSLSLLNVALVTIQQRVREVGIRRSFGATTGRIFFSVMMESVVATAVAGAVGVVLAVGLVTSPLTARYLLDGVQDVPPFPVDAALLGVAVSIAVGALAGVVPALIAARVKIVDAIRF